MSADNYTTLLLLLLSQALLVVVVFYLGRREGRERSDAFWRKHLSITRDCLMAENEKLLKALLDAGEKLRKATL